MLNGNAKGPNVRPKVCGNKYVFGLIESKSRFLIQRPMKSNNNARSVAHLWMINSSIKP